MTSSIAPTPVPEFHRSDDAAAYEKNASFVYGDEATRAVLKLLDAQPGEKILDVGCGNGQLTMRLGKLVGPSGKVHGTDASSKMIQAARSSLDEAVGVVKSNTTYEVVDAHELHAWLDAHPAQRFDKAFRSEVYAMRLCGICPRSNAALHWMKKDPRRVVSNVYHSLRPGGVFAAEMGGFLNIIGLRGALHSCLRRKGLNPDDYDPWYFPTPEAYTKILQEQGFVVEQCELVPRPTPLPRPTGLEGWLQTFIQPFTSAFASSQEKQELVKEVLEMVRPDSYDASQDLWTIMNVRLRFRVVKPKSVSASS